MGTNISDSWGGYNSAGGARLLGCSGVWVITWDHVEGCGHQSAGLPKRMSDCPFSQLVNWMLKEFLLHKQKDKPRDKKKNAVLGQNKDPHGPIFNIQSC